MGKKMLIDASHPEETRVVVLDGKKLEDFDVETTHKKLVKGNIYLAKIIRIEPSLQAAFVEYGGNRHGFLPFSEIHPDYYRIPIEDKIALEKELEAERSSDSSMPLSAGGQGEQGEDRTSENSLSDEKYQNHSEDVEKRNQGERDPSQQAEIFSLDPNNSRNPLDPVEANLPIYPQEILYGDDAPRHDQGSAVPGVTVNEIVVNASESLDDSDRHAHHTAQSNTPTEQLRAEDENAQVANTTSGESSDVEIIGGVEEIEANRRLIYQRLLRRYKIQEVIKRRQVMLIQVTKEEKANKGAAITTYISLAGRYCVLMPNSGRSGGGVSRKITSAADRKRLKSIIDELEMPKGMAVIIRTAGSERSKSEIKRDCEYLTRLWGEIRELTIHSSAPSLVYEEANLIKRAVRDLYTKEIEEIIVSGDEAYKTAKAFMRVLVPSHARRVQQDRNETIPLFQQYEVESLLLALLNPRVQLRSGGYIVIDHTEALVAIDVNSGRATRERHIEETALKTNLEAADEIARQIRLRDLSGLIVIDFIDMESASNNQAVERRLKEAMKIDRARIQIGRISTFGLLELSRQRLRPSLLESNSQVCHFCGGSGHLRSTESICLDIIRQIESDGFKKPGFEIQVVVAPVVATYILNYKRHILADIEKRHHLAVVWMIDEKASPIDFKINYLGEIVVVPKNVKVPATAIEQETLPGKDIFAHIRGDGEEEEQQPKQRERHHRVQASAEESLQEKRETTELPDLENAASVESGHEKISEETTTAEGENPLSQEKRRRGDRRNDYGRANRSKGDPRHPRNKQRGKGAFPRPPRNQPQIDQNSSTISPENADESAVLANPQPIMPTKKEEVMKVLYSSDGTAGQDIQTKTPDRGQSARDQSTPVYTARESSVSSPPLFPDKGNDDNRQAANRQKQVSDGETSNNSATAEKQRKGWWRRLIS